MKIGICDTILAINPKAEVSVSGDDINKITWHNGTTPIPANQILAKQSELQAEYEAKQYQRNRAKEYPDFKE